MRFGLRVKTLENAFDQRIVFFNQLRPKTSDRDKRTKFAAGLSGFECGVVDTDFERQRATPRLTRIRRDQANRSLEVTDDFTLATCD